MWYVVDRNFVIRRIPVVNRLGAGLIRNRGSIPGRSKRFFLLQSFHTGSIAHPGSNGYRDSFDRGIAAGI